MRISSCAGSRECKTLRKLLVERVNQLQIGGFALQTAIDLDASGFEKAHESIEARAYVGSSQSLQRVRKKIAGGCIDFQIEPSGEAGRLAAILHVAAALVFGTCKPFRVGHSVVALRTLFADSHARAAQLRAGAADCAGRRSVGELQ